MDANKRYVNLLDPGSYPDDFDQMYIDSEDLKDIRETIREQTRLQLGDEAQLLVKTSGFEIISSSAKNVGENVVVSYKLSNGEVVEKTFKSSRKSLG